MKSKEILKVTEHRPWPLPTRSWKFYQEWNEVLFLHWQVELDELQKFVPKALEIDCFDGKPWVSVVAFTMENSRFKNMPAFSPLSTFDEVNIRTYVKSGTKSGVYFLSIEVGNAISCRIARSASELPYRYSAMQRGENYYRSRNTSYQDQLNIEFTVGERIHEKSEMEHWLTERYALFQDTPNTINAFEIHHLPWELQQLNVERLTLAYPRFSSLLQGVPHTVQYSKGVQVLAWGKNC